MDPWAWFRKQIETADTDRLREMLSTFASMLMNAEVDALCGAEYGERTPERTNSRNGYRERTWDTRAGTIELAIPKLRAGTYFPDPAGCFRALTQDQGARAASLADVRRSGGRGAAARSPGGGAHRGLRPPARNARLRGCTASR